MTTPMMKQWHACKAKAKDALLLFRLGDFYEAFYDDAKLLSEKLEVTLTSRANIPMSGVPAHTADGYIEKLIAKNIKVAIAEQTEDPKAVKGIVKREVVKILSPGCVQNPNLLDEKSYNFFGALSFDKKGFAYSYLDLTTGSFFFFETSLQKSLLDHLYKYPPKELLVDPSLKTFDFPIYSFLKDTLKVSFSFLDKYSFDLTLSQSILKQHFEVESLEGFGLTSPLAVISSGVLLKHLSEELCQDLSHVETLQKSSAKAHLSIDAVTQHHLELMTASDHGKSLYSHIDYTKTAMGGRLLKTWLSEPSMSKLEIDTRLKTTETMLEANLCYDELLSQVKDLERMMTRITSQSFSPKDLLNLASSLRQIPAIVTKTREIKDSFLESLIAQLDPLSDLCDQIETTLTETPPLKTIYGDLIKSGVSERLDELKGLKANAQDFLIQYQMRLRAELDIKTLKVGFSKAFGYYIEVSRAQSQKMPSSFHKRQTLTNAERYISDELAEFENKILSAEEAIIKLEQTLFEALVNVCISYEKPIRSNAKILATIDCLNSYFHVAKLPGYTKPNIVDQGPLTIENGRHPIVESIEGLGSFIPNDTKLNDETKLYLITGPNMAGKSTYIRQVALITIMAQMGLHVPAEKASIGLVDQIFSRIGASDDLAKGQSTFMVEMIETASILNNATSNSLIILDEIGRGTSTYDGVSIAWAVAEYLLKTPGKQAKTLLATHYFELTELPEMFSKAKNFNIAVEETIDSITFLRKIVEGSADKSYGIHVAKLAGMPKEALQIAKRKLASLEKHPKKAAPEPTLFDPPIQNESLQLLEELQELSLESMSPIEAFDHLRLLQKRYQT